MPKNKKKTLWKKILVHIDSKHTKNVPTKNYEPDLTIVPCHNAITVRNIIFLWGKVCSILLLSHRKADTV